MTAVTILNSYLLNSNQGASKGAGAKYKHLFDGVLHRKVE